MKLYALPLLVISFLANPVYAVQILTLAPAQGSILYGDAAVQVKGCVTDGGNPVSGATFTAGVYYLGLTGGSVHATIQNTPTDNTIVSISGQTDATGCLTFPVSTYGIPPTIYGLDSVYLLVFTGSINSSINFFVNDFFYMASYPAITADGQYAVKVQISANGSPNLRSITLLGVCSQQTHPSLSFGGYTSKSTMTDSTNTATFFLNVAGYIYVDPSSSAGTGQCHFYNYYGSNSLYVPFYSVNTCFLPLSPGDPNCGPAQ